MIRLASFKGLAPSFHPRSLPNEAAQRAVEVDLGDGSISAIHNPGAQVGTVTVSGDRSIYDYNGTWLSWAGDVFVEESPIEDDQYQRVYYTGDGVPKLRATGVTPNVRALGVPAPDTAVSATPAARTSVTWTTKWHAFFEAADGSRSGEQDIPDANVTENVPGSTYTISPKPTGGTGTLVVWFEVYSSVGSYLGSVFPNSSVYRTSNDLLLNGAAVDSNQTTGATSVEVKLIYNTSRLTGFSLERVYVFTWVSDLEEEGPPSPPFTVEASPEQVVDLVIPTIAPYPWLTKKRIYRTVTIDNTNDFQLVTELLAEDSNYQDIDYDADLLGDPLTTVSYDPPPAALQGLVALPGGFFAGFVGNTIYFSEPYLPHAWPAQYATSLTADVVALGVSGNTLVAATKNVPYTCAGFSPDGMNPTKLSTPFAGTNIRGITELDGRVFFTSNNGIVVVDGQNPRLWTKGIIGQEYWQALNPASMRLEAHDAKMFVFHETGFLLFDLSDSGFDLTESAQVVSAHYVDRENDRLFVVPAATTGICEYGKGAPRTFTYRSKEFQTPNQYKQAAYRVIADTYPLTLNVYADGALAATVTVQDAEVHRLPATPPSKVWSLEVVANGKVFTVETGMSVEEISG